MATIYIRFADLRDRGLVRNRQQLKRLLEQGFPCGRLLSANCRVWTEEEIETYIASRPVHMPEESLRGAAKIKHEQKRAGAAAKADRLNEQQLGIEGG
jgi:hypothetical protein